MEDGTGSEVGAGRTLTYHHVLGSATLQGDTTTYPTDSGSRTDVYCLSCHVDHDLFSPFVTGTFERSANLRKRIGSAEPATTADATNTDFFAGLATLAGSNLGYTDVTSDWTNDANITGAPDSNVASSPTDNAFEMRSTFTIPTPLTSITAASLTVRSRAAGNWGAGASTGNTATALPNSDVAAGDWTRSTGTNAYYTYVDDPVGSPNDATDYVLTSVGPGAEIRFGVSGFSLPANATNIAVSVIARDRDATTGGNTYWTTLNVGGTWTPHATTRNPNGATWEQAPAWVFSNPAGGPWTPTAVNSIQGVGLDAGDANPIPWVTQVYVSVTYDTTMINDDTWAIQYTTDGSSWANVVAPNTAAEAVLTSHTIDLTGILTAANSSNFAVRILGATVGSADNSGTSVAWDASALQLTYRYPNPAGNGVCMSCHDVALARDNSNQKAETNSSYTPALSADAYQLSAHTYDALSTFTDNSTFRADCSKCHDSEIDGGGMERGANTTGFQTSTNKFSVHYSAARRILGAMGLSVADPPGEENVCYACHSTPSIGYKPVAGMDWYNVIGMSAASQQLYDVIGRGVASANTRTSVLFFRPTGNGAPAEPMPNAHQTGDTFAGGTWMGRLMAPDTATTTYETKSQAMGASNGNWQMVTFTSPSVADTITVGAGNWTINLWAMESAAAANAFVRYQIYKWNANDTKGSAVNVVTTDTTELGTTAAPGTPRTIVVSGGAVTLYPGDKISVCLEINENVTGAYNGIFYFGAGASSNLVMPDSVNFTWANPGGSSHNVAAYNGLHRPSPLDETRAYLSANKHVECADCHNVHEAKAGLHTVGGATGNVAGNVLLGSSGVAITPSGTNWTAPTYSEVATVTYEYQVCLKCHSGYNTSLTSWDAGWTNVALEFSPNNGSYHPVFAALPATDLGENCSNQLVTGQMSNGWAVGGTMTCSDCHGAQAASPAAQGPHGSSIPYMLYSTSGRVYWPLNSAGTAYTNGGNRTGLFCDNCHVNGTGGNNVHGAGGDHPNPCYACHILVPHGGKVSRLIADNVNMPTRYAYQGNLSNVVMRAFIKTTAQGYSSDSGNCNVTCDTRHALSQTGRASDQNW
jgi:hypothetical protein